MRALAAGFADYLRVYLGNGGGVNICSLIIGVSKLMAGYLMIGSVVLFRSSSRFEVYLATLTSSNWMIANDWNISDSAHSCHHSSDVLVGLIYDVQSLSQVYWN